MYCRLEKIPTVGWECSKRWFGGLVHLYVRYSQALMCVLQLVIIHGTPRALAIHGTVIHQHVTNHIHIIAVSWIIPLITHTLKKL